MELEDTEQDSLLWTWQAGCTDDRERTGCHRHYATTPRDAHHRRVRPDVHRQRRHPVHPVPRLKQRPIRSVRLRELIPLSPPSLPRSPLAIQSD